MMGPVYGSELGSDSVVTSDELTVASHPLRD
ncbi:unannotated protein [freshwater metagenome]|uniref:Unannotated protein n=1 Tax=freshwater metagenome TaxID=449393 RepID=A0A6J6T5Y9_9ZZZZ